MGNIRTDLQIEARHSGAVQAHDGETVPIRATRDGIPFTATWKQSLLLEGSCFHASFAAMGATDIVALTGGLDLDQPDFGISCPEGTSIIPLRIVMAGQYDADATDDDAFAIVMVDTDAAFLSGAVADEPTVIPMITGSGLTSVCYVFEDASGACLAVGGGAATVTKLCLDCVQQQTGIVGGVTSIRLEYEPAMPVIIDGPCCIYGYMGGTTDSPVWAGFAEWAEVPTSRFKV